MGITNISTNIIRDSNKSLDYIVTPNAIQIFDRIFNNANKAQKSFTLIGNYGTGKSTFLWAVENNLNRKKIFFNDSIDSKYSNFEFIKIIGENLSLTESFANTLDLKVATSNEIIKTLENKRREASEDNKGLVIEVDEFGKFLEYINNNKQNNDLYLLQTISEWANNDANDVYFILTLHQSFISYSTTLDITEKLEWEKIKGRFTEIPFNEPIEQLLFFASKKLEHKEIPTESKSNFSSIIEEIKQSKLVSFNESTITQLSENLYPLDWLSANILVQALQRYGQNERSLFTFLNDSSKNSIQSFEGTYYTVEKVFNYIISSLGSEILSYNNPHRPQWQTCFKILERIELIHEFNFKIGEVIVKTVCLCNLFTKNGGLFDEKFITDYVSKTTEFSKEDVLKTLRQLDKAGVIRFYKYSNKINFQEGTDIDLEQELANISKEINPNFSVSNEIQKLVEFPVIPVKKYTLETGTPRFFAFQILNNLNEVKNAQGVIDGYINLIFDEQLTENEIKKSSINTGSNIFVMYKNYKNLKKEIITINKLILLDAKFNDDLEARKIINREKEFHIEELKKLVLENLYFSSGQNVWYFDGTKLEIYSKKILNEHLSNICFMIFPSAPILNNELFNKEFLSSQISTARKSLVRQLFNNENLKDIGFDPNKYPPEKAIYITLLKNTGLHSKKEDGTYGFCEPFESTFIPIWEASNKFLKEAHSSRKKLSDLYELFASTPFKLKKGFVDFWIPILLIIKKEDIALYHEQTGFIPYISEEILDLIYKAPEKYYLRSYEISGLQINILESYKLITNIEDSSEKGNASTLLEIYGNFYRFYKGLNNYSLNTKNISPKSMKLRDAIKIAKDPEDALFTLFPEALGFKEFSMHAENSLLQSYAEQIQFCIRELRTLFDNLLERIEAKILQSFNCKLLVYEDYKTEINMIFKGVNENLLATEPKVIYKRLISPLPDRKAWVKSVADAVLGKSIDNMLDFEEPLLISNLENYIDGLINSIQINEGANLVPFKFYKTNGNVIKGNILLNEELSKEATTIKDEFEHKLASLDFNEKKQILMDLLIK